MQLLYTDRTTMWLCLIQVNDIGINTCDIFLMSHYQKGRKCQTQRRLCVISVMTPPFSGRGQSCRENDHSVWWLLKLICIHQTHMQPSSQEDMSPLYCQQHFLPHIYCGTLVKNDKCSCVIKAICSFYRHCSIVSVAGRVKCWMTNTSECP